MKRVTSPRNEDSVRLERRAECRTAVILQALSHFLLAKCGHGSRSSLVVQESANFAKCLDQIQPTRSLGSSWFLASHSSPFSAMTSKI